MLILLPPSETKRDGGDSDAPLEVKSLRFTSLAPVRSRVLRAVRALSRDEAAAIAALKLGPRQHEEVARNRAVTSSPTMAAIDRYTGVLFDALEPTMLSAQARTFAHEHLVVHSALLGPVAALDRIPAYRLSWDSRLAIGPKALSLAAAWARPVASVFEGESGLILDVRSEGYTKLGRAPGHENSVYLRVVSGDDDGRRALNHFNKRSKGLFVRALLESGIAIAGVPQLIDWARGVGFDLTPGAAGELELVAPAEAMIPVATRRKQ